MILLFFSGVTRKLNWVVLVSFVTMPKCSLTRVLVGSTFVTVRMLFYLLAVNFNLSENIGELCIRSVI